VSKKVICDGIPLSSLAFIDKPELILSQRESVEMPFRYLVLPNSVSVPLVPDGFIDLLRKSNDEGFN
jgi:ribosome biogenesis SPOUT family RNA methylase Rps3